MSSPSPRPNFTNIVAACILSGGLIASAIISSRKPAPAFATGAAVVSAEGRAVLPAPPISKESLSAQVVAQFMAGPDLQSVTSDPAKRGSDAPLEKAGKSVCKLTGVTLYQITYDAKEDTFFATFGATFRPATGKDIVVEDALSFHNDGYNQYTDAYYLQGTVNTATDDTPTVHLTVH